MLRSPCCGLSARNFKLLKGNVFAEFSVGATIAVLLRYVSHFLSGYFVFSSWRMDGYTPLTWSLVYNLFTIADLAIVLAVGLAALASKTVRRMVREPSFPLSPLYSDALRSKT